MGSGANATAQCDNRSKISSRGGEDDIENVFDVHSSRTLIYIRCTRGSGSTDDYNIIYISSSIFRRLSAPAPLPTPQPDSLKLSLSLYLSVSYHSAVCLCIYIYVYTYIILLSLLFFRILLLLLL